MVDIRNRNRILIAKLKIRYHFGDVGIYARRIKYLNEWVKDNIYEFYFSVKHIKY
jgi:hypothetical protein